MDILKNEAVVTEFMNSDGYLRKKVWCNRSNILDEQLRQWVHRMWRTGVFLTGNVIQEKGRRLQRSLNLTLPEDERTELKFSNGWLHAFNNRHKFKSYNSHGEMGDADQRGADAALPELRQLASQYALNDIFNADEFGLFYAAAPTKTIGPAPLPGKKSKATHYVPRLYKCRWNRTRAAINDWQSHAPAMFRRAKWCRARTGLRKWREGLDELGYIFPLARTIRCYDRSDSRTACFVIH